MRISFDLDGVIASTDRWFFRLFNILEPTKHRRQDLLDIMEMDYYSSRPLKYNPYFLMTPEDNGHIITSRKLKAKDVTQKWLYKHQILLPIYYIDNNSIDWTDYEKASVIAGTYKAEIINNLGVEVHLDNNPYIVEVIRNRLLDVKVILVGGD